jgi:ferredoxin--NADP+ reductase
MTPLGTETNPLRVAIIGAGPSGFFVAEHLLQQQQFVVEIDMLERLLTPYGLVRGGVAPDHQKIKAVTVTYDKIAAHPRFRFYGGVEFGTHLSLDDLRTLYHQIVFTTGAQTDQHMGIPGEDLRGSHPATEFVAWYNGHPDFRDLQFDFSCERAAVVGVGNVAVDVARILCRTPAELATTDIADYALEALRHSRIKEVVMLGRRGPAQAAFTNPELKELGELADADIWVPPAEAELDELSLQALDSKHDRGTVRKIDMLQAYARRQPTGKSRRLTIRFLVSPEAILGDADGKVTAIRLVKNKLFATDAGTLRPRPTGEYEELQVGLVFRSVGYRGVPLPEVPFDERWGVILNQHGRVLEPTTSQPLIGIYTAGWIKRGPTGVIGTNKPDALETVTCMLADAAQGKTFQPSDSDPMAAEKWLRERQPLYVSYADWLRLNTFEVARGKELGRPRVKFTRAADMLAALQKDTVS